MRMRISVCGPYQRSIRRHTTPQRVDSDSPFLPNILSKRDEMLRPMAACCLGCAGVVYVCGLQLQLQLGGVQGLPGVRRQSSSPAWMLRNAADIIHGYGRGTEIRYGESGMQTDSLAFTQSVKAPLFPRAIPIAPRPLQRDLLRHAMIYTR